MILSNYLLLTPEFVSQYQGYQSGVNTFFARQTITSDWVCSENCLLEFPGIFEGTNFTVIELDNDTDFPPPENVD